MVTTQLINLQPLKETIKAKLLEQYDATEYMNTNTVDLKLDIKDLVKEYIEQQEIKTPHVYITVEAYLKMRKLVDDTSTEIGWYGTVDKLPGINSYIINDIIVYPQIVTGATCEQDEDKMFEFEMSLTDEQVNHKRFHGHSHVNMSTGPSGVDEAFYRDILSQTTDYFIITITNKRKEYTTRFYDIENNILYTDVPINIVTDRGELLDDWYDEAKDKLTNKTVVTKKEPVKYPSSVVTEEELDDLYDEGWYDRYDRYGYDYWPSYYKVTEQKEKRKPGRPRKEKK